MPWNLLILPLLGGYYLLFRFNKFKFKQQRLDRQRLVFDTILIGTWLLFFSFIELLLRSSFKDAKLLEFTLDTDKFYIAWVKELPIPTVSNYIRVIPVFSGYRDVQKKLVFTTHYLDVYSEYVEEVKFQSLYELDVDLIITLDNLVTVSYFDIEMYERFNKPSADSKP
ncbi:hypothetical protein [Cyclobacterium amurskyense]|uniref:Uncharacterized protein n=1 Tax=Cyclobacterium amurskyense TaxID=320787 RepID=A0A0H4PEN5_9BACT|nr:hypothetical protein [Cyclobacterium amurskyense]AKP51555.1 hypothetical protein CA2015_2134 [Cyclobacterium amurskyense]